MKNKIIIFMPTIDIGGVEKNFFIISNDLSKKFNNISVISLSNEAKKKLNKKIKFIGPKTNIFSNLSRKLKFLISLYYLVSQVVFEKNVLVLCFQANMYCVFISKLFGAKVILRSNSSPAGWSKNMFKKKMYKLGFNLSNGIIVNSRKFQRQLKDRFGVKATCIYNPLNYKEIIHLSKKKIKLNFFDKKTLNIISVARFEDQKDHLTLLQAINLIKNKINVKLLLIGNGSKEYMIKEYIKKKKLEQNIKIIKNIKNPFPYIIKSDVLILSSIYEGLPNILIETIALNRFIISSNCPTGPSEILEGGKLGILFKVKNYNELGNKILFYNKNRKQLKDKIILAKKSLFKYDYKKNLNKYSGYIDSFLNI